MIIRKVKLEDAEGILEIRNDENVRKLSKNQEIIDLIPHKKWFKNKLQNKKDIYLIGEENSIILGFVRLDFIKNNEYLVSIALNSSYQGKGLGTKLLQQAISKLNKGDKIYAEILNNNKISINFFKKLGFKEIYKNDIEGKYLYLVK